MSNVESKFVLGSESKDFLSITPLSRHHPNSADYYDRNWLDCWIEVVAGGFTGKVKASLRTDEFKSFKSQLGELDTNLDGNAKYSSMEGWLNIDIQGDGLGNFTADCRTQDDCGENVLEFLIYFDQTSIQSMNSSLNRILKEFPVLGTKPTHPVIE